MPPPFVVHKVFAKNLLRDFRAVVPFNHRLEEDAFSLLSAVEPGIEAQLTEELMMQEGLKYSQVSTVEFEKL